MKSALNRNIFRHLFEAAKPASLNAAIILLKFHLNSLSFLCVFSLQKLSSKRESNPWQKHPPKLDEKRPQSYHNLAAGNAPNKGAKNAIRRPPRTRARGNPLRPRPPITGRRNHIHAPPPTPSREGEAAPDPSRGEGRPSGQQCGWPRQETDAPPYWHASPWMPGRP